MITYLYSSVAIDRLMMKHVRACALQVFLPKADYSSRRVHCILLKVSDASFESRTSDGRSHDHMQESFASHSSSFEDTRHLKSRVSHDCRHLVKSAPFKVLDKISEYRWHLPKISSQDQISLSLSLSLSSRGPPCMTAILSTTSLDHVLKSRDHPLGQRDYS